MLGPAYLAGVEFDGLAIVGIGWSSIFEICRIQNCVYVCVCVWTNVIFDGPNIFTAGVWFCCAQHFWNLLDPAFLCSGACEICWVQHICR